MNKYLFPIFMFLLTGLTVSAQLNFPDVLAFGEKIASDSTLYPTIAGRFSEGDSSLTHEELKFLYYGSAFLEGFDPYREARIIEAADALSRRNKHYESMSLLDNFLKKNPASLRALLDKAYLSWVINDSLNTKANYNRYFQLLEVPVLSGDGNSFETAFVLRSEHDEELVLNKLDYVALRENFVENNGLSYHIVTAAVEKDLDNRRDFYFLIELPLTYGKQKNVDKSSPENKSGKN